MHPDHPKAGKEFGAHHEFKVCTGGRYCGGCIGYDKSKIDWLIERTLTWEKNIGMISKTVGEYIQDIYSVVERAI